MEEEWRDIVGYEGLYKVSNKGRVKRLQGKGCKQERILKPGKNRGGYLRVKFWKDGKGINYKVHRLVAQAFIPNPQDLPEINHKDENKENNCVENLEWITHKENINHGTRNERMVKTKSKPVIGISLDSKSYLYFNSAKDAQSLAGFKCSAISACCRGKRKTAGGYHWKLAGTDVTV